MSQFSKQVDYCLHQLTMMQQAVTKKKWDDISHITNHYHCEINKLKSICSTFGSLPKTCLDPFQHLLRQQRRIMRMIDEAQQQTRENMAAADKGLRKIKEIRL